MADLVHLLHSLMLSFLLCWIHTPSHVETASMSLVTDREALMSFRSQLNVHSPNLFSSWHPNTSPCDWTGVSCNARNLRVVSLNLSDLGFTGVISPSIGNLSFLRSLQLQNNRLRGPIPKEITNLFRLQDLNLSSNSLEGSLPSNISKLVELKFLNLMSNKITGRIPDELGDLTNLQVLNLGKNLLHGHLPPSVANLSSLTTLNLGTNSLDGPIPEDLSRLRRLQVLDLTINNLTGTIPSSIYNMSSLVSLQLASNSLWGEFPSNVGYTLPNLLVFNMCFNKFSGTYPPSLHNLTNIKVIRMAHNLIEGTIPPGLGNLPFLEMYNIGFNKIVWSDDAGLESFIASLTNSTRLNFLAFDGNHLEGVLPESIGNLSKVLSKLYMGGNRISGKIPASMARLTSLTLLNMSYNSLSGDIPQEIGELQKLQVFQVAGNQLVGRIPDSLGTLIALNDIDLSQNKLEGIIPRSFGNFQGLLSMDLSNNRLNGSIPKEILNLPSLSSVLNLSKNILSGPLPQDIGRLESVVSIDLSDNQLSGNIPQSVRGCNSLEKLNMARNLLTGPIPDTIVDVKGLESLDLSSNQLSGFIPVNLQDLQALRFLNLSFNNLEGRVPRGGAFKNNIGIHLEGNPKLCLKTTCQTHQWRGKLLKVSIIVSAIATLAICVMVFMFIFSRKRKAKLVTPLSPFNEPFMNVSYNELRRATEDFSYQNMIGAGSFGSVFKGIIRGAIVAVKVIDLKTNGYYKGFIAECEALRNVRHRNLVKLITSCSSLDFKNTQFLALVYDFLCNGSLEDWIRGKRRKSNGHCLNLEERLNVAIDVASALDYLHNDCEIPVVHCDIKPSNVLLDEEMVAKVGDFGLARLLMNNTTSSQASISSTHVLKGSIGYIPPEYGLGEKPSTSGDVYSFGVMLMENISGKSPTHESFVGDESMIKWISSEELTKVIDPQLMALMEECCGEDKAKLETQVDCVKKVLEIGLGCTSYAADERMNMKDVVRKLKAVKYALLKHK